MYALLLYCDKKIPIDNTAIFKQLNQSEIINLVTKWISNNHTLIDDIKNTNNTNIESIQLEQSNIDMYGCYTPIMKKINIHVNEIIDINHNKYREKNDKSIQLEQ